MGKSRLGLYLENEDMKRRVKMAAARRGISATAYCVQAIEERLRREGEIGDDTGRRELLSRLDSFRYEIGPVGIRTSDMVKEGRRK